MYDKITDLKSGGVRFHEVETDRFKMSRLSFNFILPADRERSPIVRLMLATMMRGCRKYPSVISINKKLDEIYGATVAWRAVTVGDKHIFKISCEILGNRFRFADDSENIVERVCAVILDILFDPLIDERGLLSEANFESEKKLAIDAIQAKINNPKAYAAEKCRKLLYGDSPLGVGTEGDLEQIKNMTLEDVSSNVKTFLKDSTVECYYYGNDDVSGVKKMIDDAFSKIERENASVRGSEYCFEPESDDIKREKDSMDVSQSRLNIGAVCGTVMSDADYYAVCVFNEIFGGSSQSKLFMNVREKQSLCYYCYSSYHSASGVIMIGCGIKAENYDRAYAEIVAQLDDMKCGNITDAEIENSKKMMISGIKQMWDNPSAMEAFNFRRVLAGIDELPEQTVEKVMAVTKSDIIAAANKVKISAVYFLEGNGDGEEADYE